jgi:dihydroflavonol-4-reductase
MKAFVTGGTGFIGSEVVRRLAQGGHEVRCLVRPASDARRIEATGALLVRGDLGSRDSLLEGMKGCDWVIHVAAAYSFWEPDPRIYREVNVEGARNVMECALEAGVSKVVQVGTVVAWGRSAQAPVTEETPPGPVRFSEYARTKHEGELIAWRLRETKGLPLVVVMPGGVFGPGDPKATGRYIRDLVEGRMPARVFEKCPFPWVHVRDVAEGILRAAAKEGNAGEKYFLVAENLTFGQINRMISEISGARLPRMRLPAGLAMAGAHLLTAVARLTGKPPMLGMSVDQIRTMKEGLIVDGGKAARELGIRYTPIRTAIEDEIASFRR